MMGAANLYVSRLYHLAVAKGLNGEELLKHAGIKPEQIDAPDIRIAREKLAIIVESLWDHLQDESMGLSVYPIPRGAFYMMGKLAIHEPNLEKALRAGIRFYNMVTQAFQIELEVVENHATLKFHMHPSALDKLHLFAEINLMAWHRFVSWLIAKNVTVNDFFFDYPSHNHVSEYSYLFPAQHKFNAPFLGFAFPSKLLEHKTTQSNASLKTFIKSCPVELFMLPTTDFSISYNIKKLLRKHLIQGLPVIEEAADFLHLTKRTLIRKLKEEGTSYQQLKNLVRRDQATYLLTSQKLPLGEIAEAVGFSDPAVFARAFKVWTGYSPRDYRKVTKEQL